MITVLLTYFFIVKNDRLAPGPQAGGQAALPAASEAPSASREPGAQDGDAAPASPPAPAETASPEPEVTVQTEPPAQTPAASAAPSPSSPAEPSPSQGGVEEAQTVTEPEPTPSPAPSPEGSEKGPDKSAEIAAGLPEDAAGRTVTLSFAGDVMFGGKVGELLKKEGYAYPYKQLGGIFKEDDLSVINLETPVTRGGTGAANKQYVFKSAPEALGPLKAAGIDAVNLANNHTLDQGEQGLRDTLTHLAAAGIPYVGAGLDAKEAYSARYFDRNGIRIALVGLTRVMPESSWQAGSAKPGLASVYDSAAGLAAIREAGKKADLVVVIVHWGKERMLQYNDVQQKLGRSFIDAGADLVVGGHPHVLQGIEPYKGKWIAYSTGNFIFTRSANKDTWDTAVVQARCSGTGQCSLKLKPYTAALGQPVPMSPDQGSLLLQKLESLSAGKVNIDSKGNVTQK